MSVYIKGMEMPTSCFECPLLDYEQGFCLASAVKNEGGWCEPVLCPGGIKGDRHDECPLIPVPPHGDLIDRDALMKDGWLSLHKEVMRMGGYAIHELPLANPSIPVVIEKENC